jgi:predicted phosphodiesterase
VAKVEASEDMRIAVLADIHGNMPAFEAALEHVAHQGVDQVIIAGDLVVGAPESAACWQLAQSLNCPIVRGNHEGYVARYGTASAPPEWQTRQFTPIQWAAAQFTEAQRQAINQLPPYLRLPDMPDLLIVHASLRNDRDTIMAHTPETELAAMFPDVCESLIVRAHNHQGQVRLWAGHQIVTTGSVGLALDCHPTAQYLLLERTKDAWKFWHQSVAYDTDAAIRRFHSSGYLAAAGPMAQLYLREVATASFYIVPFLKAYQRWSHTEHLSLDDALARYLGPMV